MELTPEQIAELQQKAQEAEGLRKQLAALAGNKQEILDEKKQLRERLKELEDAEKERKRKEMEEKGQLKELLEAAQREAEEARKEAEDARKAAAEETERQKKERLRADFMAAVGPAAWKPEQLWPLFREHVVDAEGRTMVTFKGAQISVSELAARLPNDPDYAHHCKPTKSGGMGAPAGGTTSAPATGGNPYITGNVTQQIMLQLENPDEAAKLQREAKAAMAAQAKAG